MHNTYNNRNISIFLSEIPLLFIKEDYVIDAALIHVSPPDKSGYCSLGVVLI